MSSKIRVYELAKEAGIESKVLTAQLIEQGYDVKAYNSTLEGDVADEIRLKLGLLETRTKVEEKRIEKKGRTTIIRRRRTKVLEEVKEEVPPVEAAAPEDVKEAPISGPAVEEEVLPEKVVTKKKEKAEEPAEVPPPMEAAEKVAPEEPEPDFFEM